MNRRAVKTCNVSLFSQFLELHKHTYISQFRYHRVIERAFPVSSGFDMIWYDVGTIICTMLPQVICNSRITFCRSQGLRVLGHRKNLVGIWKIREYPQPHLITLPNCMNAAGQHLFGCGTIVLKSFTGCHRSCLRNADSRGLSIRYWPWNAAWLVLTAVCCQLH